MAKQMQKTLQDYLSKIKKPKLPSKTLSSSSNWMLGGCRHARTQSIAFDLAQIAAPQEDGDSATLSDIDRFLSENFKSLYKNGASSSGDDKEEEEEEDGGNKEKKLDPRPDLRAGESIRARIHGIDGRETAGAADDFIALQTRSPSPHDDFRNSMQEMMEARRNHGGKAIDWEFMEELLFSFLNLNDKKSYKYILSAFVDLVVALRENSGGAPASPRDVALGKGERDLDPEIRESDP